MVKVCYFAGISPCFAPNFAGRNSSLNFARHTADPSPSQADSVAYSQYHLWLSNGKAFAANLYRLIVGMLTDAQDPEHIVYCKCGLTDRTGPGGKREALTHVRKNIRNVLGRTDQRVGRTC